MLRLCSLGRRGVDDFLLFLETLFLLMLVAIGLRWMPLKTLLRHLPRPRRFSRQYLDPERGRRVAWALNAAARRFPGFQNCLVQALAVHILLLRRGVASVLRIGAPVQAEAFAAHAWIEVGGRPLIGGPVEHFQVLFSYP